MPCYDRLSYNEALPRRPLMASLNLFETTQNQGRLLGVVVTKAGRDTSDAQLLISIAVLFGTHATNGSTKE